MLSQSLQVIMSRSSVSVWNKVSDLEPRFRLQADESGHKVTEGGTKYTGTTSTSYKH